MLLSVLSEIQSHRQLYFSDICLKFQLQQSELTQIVEVLKAYQQIEVQKIQKKCSGCLQCPSDCVLIAT